MLLPGYSNQTALLHTHAGGAAAADSRPAHWNGTGMPRECHGKA